MDIQRFSKRMIELMPQCIRGFSRHESNHLSRGKITMPQLWALEYLSRQKEGMMSELADSLSISRPAATGLVNRLIAQGLVKRTGPETDRREVHVTITPKGKKIVAGIWEQKRNTLVKVFSKLSAHDRQQHLMILERVNNILSETPVPKKDKPSKKSSKALNIMLAGIFLSLMLAKTSFSAEPLSLQDCYRRALKQSERIAIQGQLIKETEGRFLQALNGVLPSVAFVYTETRQDGSGSSNFTLRKVPEAKFTFTQPLFSGFKQFAALSGSKAEFRQRALEKIRAEQLLFVDVADAFYNFLLNQENLAVLEATREALANRVEELHKREELGRSRTSEVASAESKLIRVEADIETAHSAQIISRQLLEFLTGQTIESVVDQDQEQVPLSDEKEYLVKAMERPDVKAAEQNWIVTRKQVMGARSGYWPNIFLDGNYYTKRVGNAANVDWDVTLNFVAPIFDGALTIGKVKEAKAIAEEARLVYSEAQRNAVLDIRNSYARVQAAINRTAALEKSVSAAERNYNLQKEDYGRSLVNNLDVLQALEDLQISRRDYIAAKYFLKQQYWKLQLSIGNIPYDTI